MSDFEYENREDSVELYATAKQIEELNRIIIDLRKQIVFLEARVAEYEKVPIARGIVEQVVKQKNENQKLKDDIAYYEKYVPPEVIINRRNKKKPTRNGGIPK